MSKLQGLENKVYELEQLDNKLFETLALDYTQSRIMVVFVFIVLALLFVMEVYKYKQIALKEGTEKTKKDKKIKGITLMVLVGGIFVYMLYATIDRINTRSELIEQGIDTKEERLEITSKIKEAVKDYVTELEKDIEIEPAVYLTTTEYTVTYTLDGEDKKEHVNYEYGINKRINGDLFVLTEGEEGKHLVMLEKGEKVGVIKYDIESKSRVLDNLDGKVKIIKLEKNQ